MKRRLTVSLFSQVVEDHCWDLTELTELKLRASEYHEFDIGFVMLVPEAHGTFRLISAAINDDYNNGMWRCLSRILKRRQGPTYMQFTKNYDRLYQASKRYGSIELFDGIVLFP